VELWQKPIKKTLRRGTEEVEYLQRRSPSTNQYVRANEENWHREHRDKLYYLGCSLEKTQKSGSSWFLNHELLNKEG
ncbi:unnamed protein product, partial [Linum tenue]